MRAILTCADTKALLWIAVAAIALGAPSTGWAQQQVEEDPAAFRQQVNDYIDEMDAALARFIEATDPETAGALQMGPPPGKNPRGGPKKKDAADAARSSRSAHQKAKQKLASLTDEELEGLQSVFESVPALLDGPALLTAGLDAGEEEAAALAAAGLVGAQAVIGPSSFCPHAEGSSPIYGDGSEAEWSCKLIQIPFDQACQIAGADPTGIALTIACTAAALHKIECTRLEADNDLADTCALEGALNALDASLANLNGKTDELVDNSEQTAQALLMLQATIDLVQSSLNEVRNLLSTPLGQREGFPRK